MAPEVVAVVANHRKTDHNMIALFAAICSFVIHSTQDFYTKNVAQVCTTVGRAPLQHPSIYNHKTNQNQKAAAQQVKDEVYTTIYCFKISSSQVLKTRPKV
jgi:hypothetical protein